MEKHPPRLLTELPDEVLMEIIKNLDLLSRPNLVLSCHRFHDLKEDVYQENVRSNRGQPLCIKNCPRCQKIMTIPSQKPKSKIFKKLHRRPVVRSRYGGRIYCSCACAMEHLILGTTNNKLAFVATPPVKYILPV